MKILLNYMLMSIVITFIILYLITPEPQVIIKYPNIIDDVSDLYVDDNDICYRYHREEIN